MAVAAAIAVLAAPAVSSATALRGGTAPATFGEVALVKISLGGPKLVFVVDTGAATSAITTTAAKALGFTPSGPTQTVSTIGCSATEHLAQISGWTLGRIPLPTTQIGIINSSLGKESPHGPAISGLLGSDVLSQFGRVTFDLVHNRLVLGGRSTGPGAGIPMTVTRDERGIREGIRATISGRTSSFVLDTGASVTLLQASTAKRLGLVLVPGSFKLRGAAGCSLKARATQIIEWSASGMPLPSTLAVSAREPSIRASPTGPPVGLIGAETLFAFGRLEFDFTHRRLILGAPRRRARTSTLASALTSPLPFLP